MNPHKQTEGPHRAAPRRFFSRLLRSGQSARPFSARPSRPTREAPRTVAARVATPWRFLRSFGAIPALSAFPARGHAPPPRPAIAASRAQPL